MFVIEDSYANEAVIKVIGVGGGGGNAVSNMLQENLEGVDFICANTDVQALNKTGVNTLIPLGSSLTKGLGAGANPNVGHEAALEDAEHIREKLHHADMVFITAGMGGGTGTGAAPVVAEIAREMGILTVAVVTKPFGFEGKRRSDYADQGIEALRQHVDSLISIPNDKLQVVLGSKLSLLDAFKAADNVLLDAVQGISELITKPGLINVDFADVRTVMSEMGMAMMGSGDASGEHRAVEAAEKALSSPLLDDINLTGAKGILINITGGTNLSIGEFEDVGNTVRDYADDDATVVVGTVIDPDMGDTIRVTIVATGIGNAAVSKPPRPRMEVFEPPVLKPQDLQKVANGEDLDPVATDQDYDQPAVIRKNPEALSSVESTASSDMEYLDIPAFLRRQAD